MAISLDLHNVASIHATASLRHGTFSAWLTLEFKFAQPAAATQALHTSQESVQEPPFEITVFMTNRETAKAYADAINAAESLQPAKARAKWPTT